MSTARAHFKEDKHTSRGQHGDSHPNHLFRNVLLISLVLAALVLWQLNPIITGLNAIKNALMHARGVRSVIAGILSMAYLHIASIVGPLVHRIIG